MGKVLSNFDLGWPGAISRSVDDIVVSLKNADTNPIPFGAPVFLKNDGSVVVAFITNGSQTFEKFVGIQAGQWKPGEVIEVLVRGSISVKTVAGFEQGGKVYIRKADGALVPNAGSEGTTLRRENVRIKQPQLTSGPCSEVVVTSRNIL